GRYSGVSHPVGLKRPNPWGLYDMSGNVSEWCEDDWHETYVGAPTDGNAWIDSPPYGAKVARGGCFNDYPWNCLSAGRNVLAHYEYQSVLGFRLVRNSD
ncbi:MAG: formylglycine-generating enzyme family protein, partial [bacterium]|nr:formylglycine-generating enzyme family protein [bacterium]